MRVYAPAAFRWTDGKDYPFGWQEINDDSTVRAMNAAGRVYDSPGAAAAAQALVSGGGSPAYVWANRPDPAANAGNIIRITDVGPTGAGSLWISDGTVWRALGGRQVLSSSRAGAPGAALATATGIAKLNFPAGSMVSGGSIVLPVGLMRVGTGLRASIMMRHTGTAGTFSAALRFGTLNTSSDNSFASCQGAASNDIAAWAFSEASVSGATSFVAKFLVAPNGATNTPQNRTTNFDITQPLYLGLYVSALTAPDTLELLDYSLEFQD